MLHILNHASLFVSTNVQEMDEAIDRYNRQIETMSSQIVSLRCGEDSQLKDKLAYAINLIKNLAEMFTEASPEAKIKIIGSIFPEKIVNSGEFVSSDSRYRFPGTRQIRILRPGVTRRCLWKWLVL